MFSLCSIIQQQRFLQVSQGSFKEPLLLFNGCQLRVELTAHLHKHTVKIASRLAALIHTSQRDGNLGQTPKVKSGRQIKYVLLKWNGSTSLCSRLYTHKGWDTSTPLNVFKHVSYIQQRGPNVFPEFRLQKGQTQTPLGCTHSLHGLRVTFPHCCLQALVQFGYFL